MAIKKHENGYGKFEKWRGAIVHLNEVSPARSKPEIPCKGGGKTTNYALDNDDAFDRRLARHKREQEAEAAAEKEFEELMKASRPAAPEASGANPEAA